MDQIVLTPAALLDLLSQIYELEDKELSLVETADCSLQLQIGDSTYNIKPEKEETVYVEEDVVDDIQTIDSETYEDLGLSDNMEVEHVDDSIEGGIIKEIAKTLLVGGMVRLTNKLLKNKVSK